VTGVSHALPVRRATGIASMATFLHRSKVIPFYQSPSWLIRRLQTRRFFDRDRA